ITTLCEQLQQIGVDIKEKPDGFIVHGGKPLSGGRVSANGDHRLAMALAVAGLAAKSPVEVEGAEVISESFPTFADLLKILGADISIDA
ncbi:MAG: hypothetical protein R6V73_05260, partial [Anaerolineales bacterium]